MTKKRECKTEIDWEREKHSTTTLLSAEPHTNPGEEACRRPVMEANAHRKQAGTDRKPDATQQQGSHSPATTPAYCKLLIHKQTNQLRQVYVCTSACLSGRLSMCICTVWRELVWWLGTRVCSDERSGVGCESGTGTLRVSSSIRSKVIQQKININGYLNRFASHSFSSPNVSLCVVTFCLQPLNKTHT